MENTGIIMEKLKKHPHHKLKTLEEKEKLAIELTSPEKLSEQFSHLLEAGNRLAIEFAHEDYDEFQHSMEIDAHHQRVKHGTAKACHLPVKLSLQKLRGLRIKPPGAHTFTSWLKFEYGPHHAALIVGDVTIQWGKKSVVEPRFDSIPQAKFQVNVGDQGDWHEQQAKYEMQMSLADRQRNSIQKLETLSKSMTEKAQLIERLVGVIVDYNRNKKYNVFTCNCQDFVRDAMAALGIKKPVKFDGRLQEYYEQLVKGNIKIPPELKRHESLDEYVEANIQELGRQDMEYLQCLYFEVHLPSLEESDDPDEWECAVPTCKSAQLDRLIQQHALPFDQSLPGQNHTTGERDQEATNDPIFKQTILPEPAFGGDNHCEKRKASKDLTLISLKEDKVVNDLFSQHAEINSDSDMSSEDEDIVTKFMSMSMEEQRKLAARFSGYEDDVKCKFRDHPQYVQEKEDQFVDVLTEVGQFYEYFFSSIPETTEKVILEISADHGQGANNYQAWEVVCHRARERFRRLSNFPMKLIYHVDRENTKPRQAALETPLLVSLQVDNHTLEWNRAGLVIPCEINTTHPVTADHLVLVQNLAHQSQWSQFVNNWTSQIDEALQEKDENTVMDIMCTILTKKEQLILSLIKLITSYNRYKRYDPQQCNNHQFVHEAMEALGIQDPPAISTTLKSHLQTLAPNTTLADKHFPTHKDLDLYLFENIGGKTIGPVELELLISKYFMFHMEKKKYVKEWTCNEPTCQLLDLLKV